MSSFSFLAVLAPAWAGWKAGDAGFQHPQAPPVSRISSLTGAVHSPFSLFAAMSSFLTLENASLSEAPLLMSFQPHMTLQETMELGWEIQSIR